MRRPEIPRPTPAEGQKERPNGGAGNGAQPPFKKTPLPLFDAPHRDEEIGGSPAANGIDRECATVDAPAGDIAAAIQAYGDGKPGAALEVPQERPAASAPTKKDGTTTSPPGQVKKTDTDMYQIGRLIGNGGMGDVYEATRIVVDKVSGETVIETNVAMKIIGEHLKGPQLRERFIDEVKLVARLSHDNIVGISDFGVTDDGRPFFIMELLNGKDLDDIIDQSKRLSWEQTRQIAVQVCSALVASHEYTEKGRKMPIIHRDIKPGNIFLTSNSDGEQRIKVLDFGIARIADPDEGQTPDGRIVGSCIYMSPEQMLGMPVDERGDLYSLGVVMYELVTGTWPFDFNSNNGPGTDGFQSDFDAFAQRVHGELPNPPSRIAAGLPEEADAIIMKCLAKKPEDRYSSARELRETIRGSNGHANGDTAPPIVSQRVLEGRRKGGGPSIDERMGTQMFGQIHRDENNTDLELEVIETPPSRWKRWVAAAAFIAVAGVGGSFAALGWHSRNNPPAVEPEPAPKVVQEKPKQDEPKPEPTTEEKIPELMPMNDNVVELHTVTFRTNLAGVEVVMGEEVMCTTTEAKECSFQIEHGAKQAFLGFRKTGYKPRGTDIVPDSNQTITLHLEKRKRERRSPAPRASKPKIPMITSE
jgi:serine/threonine-protein kinase